MAKRRWQEPDWERAPEFGRRETLLRALRRLWELRPGPSVLVEAGTLRNDSPSGLSGDGWSTIAWGWYAQQTGGKVWTVDIHPDYIATCRRLTAPYAAHLEYVVSDSVAFLQQWRRERRDDVHLLYLDSLDYLDHAASEAHCLAEAQAALSCLAAPALILFDDTSPTGPAGEAGLPPLIGKGTQAVPFMVAHGFALEWLEGGQALLSR